MLDNHTGRTAVDALEYRRAVAADEDALVELWWGMQSSHHAYEPLWYNTKSEGVCKGFWREHFRELIADQDAVLFVAASSTAVVGMVVAQIRRRPPIYEESRRLLAIASTVVHPTWRRKGVFRRLLACVEAEGKSRDIQVMKLSVHCGNPARHAYEKTGFRPETIGMIKWLK